MGRAYCYFTAYYNSHIKKDGAVDSFLKIREWMVGRTIVMWPDDNLVDKYLAKDKKRKLVFEAGQGMLLDQNRKEFMPYLTRSSTGLANVLELLGTVKTPIDLKVFIVTRTYLTRHGDGPIWNHVPNTFPFPNIEDPTNGDNPFQGKMRYGNLNREWYNKAISETEATLEQNNPSCLCDAKVSIAMTCCDHVGPKFMYSQDGDGTMIEGNILEFPRIELMSHGRTDSDISQI